MNDYSGLDPSGLARLDKLGGPAFVKKMIDLFLEEAPERVAAARNGLQAGDLVAVADAAHSIKSSAQNFGAHNLSLIAGKIELTVRSNHIENLPTLLIDLERAYAAVESCLQSQRNKLPT